MAEPSNTPTRDYYDELIAALVMGPALETWRSLPETVDEAERTEALNSEGLSLYDRMMRMVPLQAAVQQLKAAVLAMPITIGLPSEFDNVEPDELEGEDLERYDQASEVRDFVSRCFASLPWYRAPSIQEVAEQLLDAVVHGHRLAEIVLGRETAGVDAGRETLRRIKVKPRRNYRMVIDPYNNLQGILAIIPGKNLALWSGHLSDAKAKPGWVGVEKLVVLRFGTSGDPRGTSMLRAAYDPWKRIQLMRPVQVRTGVQFGGGMITATLGTNAKTGTERDEQGNLREMSAEQYALAKLKQLQSGSVAVFGSETTVEVHRPGQGGEFFKAFFDEAKRELVMAVLTSARSIMESERNSKADASGAENLLDTVVHWVRGKLCAAIGESVVRLLVERNFGVDVARSLMPTVVLGGTRWEDVLNSGSNLASLGYTFAPEHLAIVDRRFGLPPREHMEVVEGADGPPDDSDQDPDEPMGD